MQGLAGPPGTALRTDRGTRARRLNAETEAAFKTTEFLARLVVSLGILLTSFLVKPGQGG